MKKLTIQILLLAILSWTSIVQADESTEAALVDVNYPFDQTKLSTSEDAFHFLRSFVDYYYKLIPANTQALNLGRTASHFSGWCAGDAHPENFGTLLQGNGTEIFTMNDMDDSGPCPVAFDFLRLMVSSRLYQPKFSIISAIDFYEQGLKMEAIKVPAMIQSMLNEGLKLGESVNPKELDGNRLKRKKESSEVPSNIRTVIENDLQKLFISSELAPEAIHVIDLLSTSKAGGGSGGLLRYEVLCSRSNGELLHLELKELTNPAIAAVATEKIPEQKQRIQKSLLLEQGNTVSKYYNVLMIDNKTMLLRPKFYGNIGIALDDKGVSDNSADVINYEAYVLGRIHSQSVDVSEYLKALDILKESEWESDVNVFTKHFNKKFSQLKN